MFNARRVHFNLCGNTDDHAAFWNGKNLGLTPAYDICPQGSTGNTAGQAMLISGNNNLSQLKTCLQAAHNFLLSKADAQEIFAQQKYIIEKYWAAICDEAQLGSVDRQLLWHRHFLNPFSLE